MTISEHTAVGALAAAVPHSVGVFQRHGLDFCCGGDKSLAAVCDEAGLSFTAIAHEIEAEAETSGPDTRDWMNEPLARVMDHIVATYHDALRAGLPQLQDLADKVVRVHGAKSLVFARVRDIVGELSTDLVVHMMKEEIVLFPAIRRAAAGQPAGVPLAVPISVLEAEHDAAGALLRDLRTITDGFVAPAWGCATLRALYAQLERLEQDMQVHVHLENNVLFPRATGRVSAS
jgi:regulator of cell morphogenesis and NO signaling